jgi:hypothetical protein
MKSLQFLLASILVLAACVWPASAARADTVLYDSASFLQGQQSFVQSFNITTPGTISVSLSNIPWLDVISDLTCFLTSVTGLVGSTMTSGSESFSVGAGTIYAHWFGEAQGNYGIGVVGIKIVFQPGTVVGLPASFILLLSGLGVLFGWQRREGGVSGGALQLQ